MAPPCRGAYADDDMSEGADEEITALSMYKEEARRIFP